MPTSDAEGKDAALDWYQQIDPRVVIDVGPGEGTYAKLMRPFLRSHWIGIEAWGPYVAEYGLEEIYDIVHVADARLVDWSWFLTADLAIVGDVLEHMPKYHAHTLISRLSDWMPNLIVSVPVLHLDQDAVGGNPFERHVDHWGAEELRNYLGKKTRGRVRATWTGDVLTYAWWQRNPEG